LEHTAAENIVGAMDKNDGDNLPEWFASHLPEDPVIRADIRTRVSRETDGKNGLSGMVLPKGGRDDNLVEKKEEANAALDNQPSGVPWLLVLCLLSILAWAGYALAGSYFL
jgi:hypothetical protein